MSSREPNAQLPTESAQSANAGQALVDDGLALLEIGGLLRDGRMNRKTAAAQLQRVRRRLARHSAQMEGKAHAQR
jgi:hypothetical protein